MSEVLNEERTIPNGCVSDYLMQESNSVDVNLYGLMKLLEYSNVRQSGVGVSCNEFVTVWAGREKRWRIL